MAEVEKLRRESYDCENPDHEEMLMKVQGRYSTEAIISVCSESEGKVLSWVSAELPVARKRRLDGTIIV